LKPDGLYNKRKYSPFHHRDLKKINTSTNSKITGLSFIHPFPEISILGYDCYSQNLNNHNTINNFKIWLLNFRKVVNKFYNPYPRIAKVINKFNNLLPQLRKAINNFNNPLPQLQNAILKIICWYPQTVRAYIKNLCHLTNKMTAVQNINL
jgi:hypothetical protein